MNRLSKPILAELSSSTLRSYPPSAKMTSRKYEIWLGSIVTTYLLMINQPIFNSRKVITSLSVWDGQTVVLGGLMREDVQKTEDRTPIIGDIPLVGRLFRTHAEQHI